MKLKRVGTGFGDLLYIDATHDHPFDFVMELRRLKKIATIREMTDLTELPEYLTDEDLTVAEAAKSRLDELTGE